MSEKYFLLSTTVFDEGQVLKLQLEILFSMSMLSVVAYYQKNHGGTVARGSTSQSVGCGSGLDGFIVNSSPRSKSGISFDAGVKSIRRKTYPHPSCHRHRKNFITHNSPLIPMLKKSKY